MPVDVVITRTNSIVNSTRIQKLAASLSKRYRTKVVGWNREGISEERIAAFVTDLDVLRLKGPFGSALIIFYLPLFWSFLFAKLIKYRPSIIHACDLDTLIPSLLFKTLFRKKLVFDVCDRYALSKISPRRKILYNFVNWLEESLGERSDYMINVSEKMTRTFKHKPRNTAVIMNCADDQLSYETRDENRFIFGDSSGNEFALVYTGNIIRNRGIEQLAIATKNMNRVKLHLAGKIIDQEFYDELLVRQDIVYHGHLTLPNALQLESQADAIAILYDMRIANNTYSNPNKLFEAMMFGIPVITNIAEDIVGETSCGLSVDYRNIEQISEAIVLLRDDQTLRKRLGNNGRKAFEQQYNWRVMEKALFNIYEELKG